MTPTSAGRRWAVAGNRAVTLTEEPMPLADWQAEMKRRFPESYEDVSFRCPSCGTVSSVRDFDAAGLAGTLLAPQECIGRRVPGRGCNRASYGLFLGPRFLLGPDGLVTAVFEFAHGTGN